MTKKTYRKHRDLAITPKGKVFLADGSPVFSMKLDYTENSVRIALSNLLIELTDLDSNELLERPQLRAAIKEGYRVLESQD